MLNLNRLALLQELHRQGSIIAVADALSFTPSTVSQQLKVLEKEAGAQLFERVGRGLVLTRAGESLAQNAREIFAAVERAQAEVAAMGSRPIGDVRTAVLQTASLALLPRVLDILERTDPHPRMLVHRIEPSRALSALESREFDVVLGEEYPGMPIRRHSGVQIDPMVHDSLELVVPPTFEGRAELHNASAALPWVMEPEGSDARNWAVRMCRDQGLEPEVQFESDDLLVQMRLVEAGKAIGILPRMVLDSERPNLIRHSLPDEPTRLVFVAYRAGTDIAPAIRAVLAALGESTHPDAQS